MQATPSFHVTNLWTPAHIGTLGNELADSVAKAATLLPPSASLPLSSGLPDDVLLGPSKAGRRVSNFEDIVQQAYDDLKKRVSEEDSAAGASQTWSEPQGSVVGGEIIDFAELYQVDSGETEPLTREVIDVVGNDMLRTWRIEDFM
ncbi:hypothetical protein B0H11DRAFT_2232755 [Mycena galericulata]|nr:hypothetical protein B0H11DRAFT_2232755 [Mycena galericulata]